MISRREKTGADDLRFCAGGGGVEEVRHMPLPAPVTLHISESIMRYNCGVDRGILRNMICNVQQQCSDPEV